MKTELSVEGSIKTQRQILMAMVSSIEFLNRRYDPFDLQLNGWSEQMHESITDYDDVFEKLYFKYRNKVSAPPELQLLLMVGGSAMMFHMTNAIFKNSMLPKIQTDPDTLQKVMQAFKPQQPPSEQTTQEPQPQQQQQQPRPGGRKDMRGPMPGMDMSALLGGGMMPPLPPGMAPFGGGAMNRPASMTRTRDISELIHPGAPKPPPAAPKNPPPPPASYSGSDRLSDALSDLDSVPDDLESLSSMAMGEDEGVRSVTVSTGPKKGGRGKQQKKIVTI